MGYSKLKKVVTPWLCLFIALFYSVMLHPTYAASIHHAKTKSSRTHSVTKKISHHTSARKTTSHAKRHSKTISRVAHHKTKKSKSRTAHKSHKSKIIAKKYKTPINRNNIHETKLPNYLLNTHEKRLVDFIRESISSVKYSSYKMGGNRIDTDRGIYIVDCSAYVDHILKAIYPQAYSSLTKWSGTERPTTDDFYQYFSNLSQQTNRWETLNEIESLRPGDIIVFRYLSHRGTQTGGHVMVVMDAPKRIGDSYSLRIADSAPSGHSKDTRLNRISGVGIGTILLKAHYRTQQPIAYAWKENAPFKSNIEIAMARPISTH